VPGGGARRGRRDNGLVAAEYAVVGDVDPRIGEHLLDVLAAGGIAAYLQPATDLHPVTRTTTLPARPTDRLYADREHLATAQDYLSQLTAAPEQQGGVPDPQGGVPERQGKERTLGEDDEDAAWASIVAGYNASVDPAAVPWPEAEDVDTSGTGVADRDTEPAPHTSIRRAPDTIDPDTIDPDTIDKASDKASLLDGLDTFGADLPDDPDDDEGYTPPPPPPLPRISAATALALAALAAGLLLFFWPSLLPLPLNATLLLAFGAVLAGFIALVWRLRPGDEEGDDPDNGARV
jgi:hypothetical protein